MGRLLLRACEWLGSNAPWLHLPFHPIASLQVTLLWVLRAGRHTKDDAYQFVPPFLFGVFRQVSGIARSTARLVVLVTHMDRLFEERYREAGPVWRHLETSNEFRLIMR